MADQCQTTKSVPREVPVSSGLAIAVLSVLAAMGTLATNILLPSLPQIAISLNVTSAAVTSAITVFLAVFGIGQLLVGPLSDRYGRRWPVLIGFAVFFGGSVWCGLATDLPNLLVGRVVQAAGACATSVLSRAIARDMFSGPALARAMALIMIVMSAAPGFSPLLGGALDHSFGWRSEFALVAAFAAAGAIAYGIILGETHNSIRTPFNLVAIARTYVGLLGDRRFAIPAATASLIIGGLFSMFSAAPRLFIEALHFTPIQLGLFFAGTVFIVFAAGMLATKLAPRYGLDRPIRAGLWATAASSVAILLISMISPTFLPFLGAMCVFLLGMGVVSPLATARALSPFGEKAGAASALLGFWQMMNAAIGVWLAATVSHEAMFALGVVLSAFSLLALGLYAWGPDRLSVAHGCEVRLAPPGKPFARFAGLQPLGNIPSPLGAMELRFAAARRPLHLEHVFRPDLEVISTTAGAQYGTRKCSVVDTVLDQRLVDVYCDHLAEHEPSFDLLTARIRQLRDLGDLAFHSGPALAYPRHSDVAPGYCRQPCYFELAHAVIERRRRHVHALAKIHRNQIPDEFAGLADVLDGVLPRN